MIRAGKNGCASDVIFYGKKIYHDWDSGNISINSLGQKLDKIQWLKENTTDTTKLYEVTELFADWDLYENGWYVRYNDCCSNVSLWCYLTQIGNSSNYRPKALNYLK